MVVWCKLSPGWGNQFGLAGGRLRRVGSKRLRNHPNDYLSGNSQGSQIEKPTAPHS